ncbi:MAG: PadR family transcriptional regulator [Prochloraceae cyanobacterium]|nr:PadR family transcriptional regulator [Prochloraceae cyanobacterium]
MLKYILLGFLNYRSMTGYDLKRFIDGSTAHFWHAYHSQIYTTLRKMEQDGLVTSVIDDSDEKLERRIYEITEQGESKLKQWLGKSLTELPPSKDSLLVRLFFSGSRNRSDVLNELRFQRQLHQQQLELYQQIKPEPSPSESQANSDSVDFNREAKFWRMTLENGLAYEQMYLKWLDETIAKIESL